MNGSRKEVKHEEFTKKNLGISNWIEVFFGLHNFHTQMKIVTASHMDWRVSPNIANINNVPKNDPGSNKSKLNH